MEELRPNFEVTRDDQRREVHYVLSGLFNHDVMPELFAKLFETSKPLIDDRKGFRVFGDLRALKVQPRDIVEHIQYSQESAARSGVTRMALVYSSTLMMQQFRRVSGALNCEFFQDPDQAIDWLRG